MAKLVVVEGLSLDGVMQAPGSPDEDRSGGFEHGGWQMPYFDAVAGEEAGKSMAETGAFLFGRKTYEIMSAYWPQQPDDAMFANVLNSLPKYVASTTLEEPLAWSGSSLLKGDVAVAVADLKKKEEGNIVVLGSGQLARTLIEHDLVDEYGLMIHPLLLGGGKRLFDEGGAKRRLLMVGSKTSTTGVILATYRPEG
ncbi:MAG TPA: dihydrofolate reductase family protein [Acidimicrobiia bacterium]|jgi:dihydrofolate reductase|nr:dihydrofolate reductase family protein [Acidimicrobiia bacterium]